MKTNGTKNPEAKHSSNNPNPSTAAAVRTKALRETAQSFSAAFDALVWLASLSAEERKRIVKAHTGIEPHALALARLVKDNPQLSPTGLDPQELIDEVDFAAALLEIRGLLASQLQTIDDTYLVTRSRMYQDTLDVYVINQRNARRDPAIKKHLAAFEAFMSLGPRPKKDGAVPVVNAPAPAAEPAPATPGTALITTNGATPSVSV